MKQTYFLTLFAIISILFFLSCSSDDEEVAFSISPLTEVATISGDGQIVLSWTNPETDPLSYVQVDVTGVTSDHTEIIKHDINGERKSRIIIQVPEGREVYKFTLSAFGLSGKAYAPLQIKGKPYTNDTQSGMDFLLGTLKAESIGNGVKFSWNNSNNISCMIQVEYAESGISKTMQFDAKSAIPEAVIKLTRGADFSISIVGVEDAQGVNSSITRTESLQPNKPYKLSTNLWSVYAVSSQAATVGNGSAACAIDETPLTRWLSANKGANDSIIIDMGKPVVVERLSLARYFGVSDNSAWDVTFSVGNNPDLSTWENEYSYANSKEGVFAVEFNRTRDGDQMYPLPEPVTGRYFKYRTDRISGSWWTHYGEISVYGYYVD